MVRSLRINPCDPRWQVQVADDASNGGTSHCSLVRTDNSVRMDYELRGGYAYPFCRLALSLAPTPGRGINLSWVREICIASRSGRERGDRFRIFLHNFDSAYSRLGDALSLKYNELEYDPGFEEHPAEFSREDLRVASWWITARKVRTSYGRVQLDNVVDIEIHTGAAAPLGPGSYELSWIELRGKWISSELLYGILLTFWMTFLGVQYLHGLWEIRRRLFQERERNLRLVADNSALQELSLTDPLTGIANRRGLFARLEEFSGRLPVGILMLDLDHFKDVNDTWGHPVGDQVLIGFAHTLSTSLREGDIPGRWGGEEFLVLLPGLDAEGTCGAARRIFARLRTVEHPTIGRCTCSMGVAHWTGGCAEQAIEAADRALYRAKEGGRDSLELDEGL